MNDKSLNQSSLAMKILQIVLFFIHCSVLYIWFCVVFFFSAGERKNRLKKGESVSKEFGRM